MKPDTIPNTRAPVPGKGLSLDYLGKVPEGLVVNSSLVSSAGRLADMPPGRQLTYNEVTADTTISATTEGAATTIVTATSKTYDGITPVIIEAWFPSWVNGVSGSMTMVLWDDTAAASIGFIGANGAAGSVGPVVAMRRITPASGSRVYSIRAFRATSNGTVHAGAGGVGNKPPGFIRITKA